MVARQEHPEVKTLTTHYNHTKTQYKKLHNKLQTTIITKLRTKTRPADISQASGWDREYLRRLKAAADAAEGDDSPAS